MLVQWRTGRSVCRIKLVGLSRSLLLLRNETLHNMTEQELTKWLSAWHTPKGTYTNMADACSDGLWTRVGMFRELWTVK